MNLSYKAVGQASYWDFSAVGSTFASNLGFTYPASCGTRSSSGAYKAEMNGATVLSSLSYSAAGQSCIHMGPNYINWTGVSKVDDFSISYHMLSSTANNNIIGIYSTPASWQIWDLFEGNLSARFVSDGTTYVASQNQVPEPTTMALLGLGMLGFAVSRCKSVKSKNV